MILRRCRGLFIAFHSVPHKFAPELEAFWDFLRVELEKENYLLLLVTTTDIISETLSYISVPWLPADYDTPVNVELLYTPGPENHLINYIKSWYDVDLDSAAIVLIKLFTFYRLLLSTLQPAAVLSWQSMHPVSRVVRELCLHNGLPWCSSERGWLKDTLMIDSGENNYLSEMTISPALNRVFRSYKVNEELINNAISASQGLGTIARYPESSVQSESDLRTRLRIPSSAKLYALFTHGEPHVSAAASMIGLQQQHELLPGELGRRVKAIASVLAARGDYLIVKEHPFNLENGRRLDIHGLENVYHVIDGPDEVLEASDYLLFTLATMQFDVALRGRQFGLLCRGLLAGHGEAPLFSNYPSAESFIDDIESHSKWLPRYSAILRKISFLIEYCLLPIGKGTSKSSAEIVFQFLNNFRSERISDLIGDISNFQRQYPKIATHIKQ